MGSVLDSVNASEEMKDLLEPDDNCIHRVEINNFPSNDVRKDVGCDGLHGFCIVRPGRLGVCICFGDSSLPRKS